MLIVASLGTFRTTRFPVARKSLVSVYVLCVNNSVTFSFLKCYEFVELVLS